MSPALTLGGVGGCAIFANLRRGPLFTLNDEFYSIYRKVTDRSCVGSGIPSRHPNHLTPQPQFYQRVVASMLRWTIYAFPDPFSLVHTMTNSRVDEETALLFLAEDPVVTISGGSDEVTTLYARCRSEYCCQFYWQSQYAPSPYPRSLTR